MNQASDTTNDGAVYLMAHVPVRDWTRFKDYQQAALPTIERYGGRVLAAGRAEQLEGAGYVHNVVLEFPSADSARSWYHSDDYQASITIREECAPGAQVCMVSAFKR